MYVFSEFVHLLVVVADISVKVWQRRFITHILRQDPNNDCYMALTWNPKGKKEKTKNNIVKDRNADEINGLAILLG